MATKSNSQISTLEDDVVVEQAPEAVSIKGENFDDELGGKFEMVTIHSGNDEAGSDAVPVGLNGYTYQIPRDKPFKVPTEVVQILRDAVTTSYKPDGRGGNVERNTPRYAFSSTKFKG